jgi:hypothetical protein
MMKEKSRSSLEQLVETLGFGDCAFRVPVHGMAHRRWLKRSGAATKDDDRIGVPA